MEIDYRVLLKKYMDHVCEINGNYFLLLHKQNVTVKEHEEFEK